MSPLLRTRFKSPGANPRSCEYNPALSSIYYHTACSMQLHHRKAFQTGRLQLESKDSLEENTNNHRYEDDTILMAENKEELKTAR